MNDTITKIVALLFEDLEETEETAALHDEILQNCQERYADLTAGGMTADEATKAVIESLNGMQEMLADYPRKNARPAARPSSAEEEKKQVDKDDTDETGEEDEKQTEVYSGIRRAELRLGSADLRVRRSPDESVHLTLPDQSGLWKTRTEGDRLIVERQAANKSETHRVQMDGGLRWDGDLSKLMNSVGKMLAGISKELGSIHFSTDEEAELALPDGCSLRAESNSGDMALEGLTLTELELRSASGDLSLSDVAVENSVRLASKSGDIRWAGSAGQAELTSASGDLTLENADVREYARLVSTSGDIVWNGSCDQAELGSTSGDLRLDGLTIRQHARVTSTSGDVSWRGGCAEAEISSINGDLTADGAFPRLSMNTVSGDVHLRPVEGFQRAALKSTCGSVEVELPEGFRPQTRCHTVSGSVHQPEGMQPNTEASLEINTISGDITIE